MDWNLAGAVILSGLVIVFAALVILIGVVSLTGKLIHKDNVKPKSPTPPTSPTPPSKAAAQPKGPAAAPMVQAGIAQETVAVISAAIAAVMDEQSPGAAYVVESIQRQAGSRQGRPVWGFAGMQQNTRPF